MGAVAEFKCPPGHVYRQDTAERYVESKETSKSVDVTCEVQEGFPQWVTSHERDTLKPCRKGNRLFMCQDENESEDENFRLFWIKPVMNEPGPQYYDTLKDRFVRQPLPPERTKASVFVFVFVFVLAHEQAITPIPILP